MVRDENGLLHEKRKSRIFQIVFGVITLVILIATTSMKAHAQTGSQSDVPHRASANKVEKQKSPNDSKLKAETEEGSKPAVLENTEVEHQPSPDPAPQPSADAKWHWGGFVDVGYLLDFNHPQNRVFRSRGTTWHVDRPQINMAAFYVKKKASPESRWGIELTAQAGKDAQVFGFSATAPNIDGYKFLRQLGSTNVSYLAPVGKGLLIQGGIFSSFIGYDSLYAEDNFNYTRPWGADFTPYFMLGVNASYPFTEKITGTFFVVNGYWHLANANSVPSFGGQAAFAATPRLTIKQTVLAGPHQKDTAFNFWRFISDMIVEHKTEKRTFAFNTNWSTEQVDSPGAPRAWWFAAQGPMRFVLDPRWAVAFRPEVAHDSLGRWTLARQTVFGFTSTLEYKLPYKSTDTIFRLEHRFDRSTGPEGGFFRGREVAPGVVPLTPNQHLLIFATIFTFDR